MRSVLATLLLLAVGVEGAEPVADGYAESIERLGHPVYEVRLDARRGLLDEGLKAFDALRAAQEDPDPEVSDASRRLLSEMTADLSQRGDPPTVRRLLEAYDEVTPGRRLAVIGALASMPGEQALPALVRLARFDPSDLAAREAARAVLAAPEFVADARREDALRAIVLELNETYGAGARPAARWLGTAVGEALMGEPAKSWRRYAEAQRSLLDTGRGETNDAIVATLHWRWLRAALRGADDAEASAAAEGLVALDPEEAVGRLSRVLRWCSLAQRWPVVDGLTARHAPMLKSKRGLYVLADVADRRGDAEEAARLAAEALDSAADDENASVQDVLLGPRVTIARELYESGRSEWAIAEYRRAAETTNPLDGQAATAAWRLSTLLFDAERYAEAAAAIEPLAEAIDRSRPARGEYGNLPQVQTNPSLLPDSGQLIARQRFSTALAERAAGNREGELSALRRAIAADPHDADVLIAMHRVADPPPAFATETRRRIDAMRLDFEREIWDRPQDADPFNQWAWLVSNTEGDFDKAVRYSRRSLQIEPETAGYLDTLGRCLFAAGKLEEAIETQRRAVELEPRMLVLQRQLAEFEAELEKRRSDQSGPSDEAQQSEEPIL